MAENLYIRGHRYTNPKFRDEWERIFNGLCEEEKTFEEQVKEQVEKEGKVLGHFI